MAQSDKWDSTAFFVFTTTTKPPAIQFFCFGDTSELPALGSMLTRQVLYLPAVLGLHPISRSFLSHSRQHKNESQNRRIHLDIP